MDMFLCDVWIIHICVNCDLWTINTWYCINVVTSHWSVYIWYLVLHFGLCICVIICSFSLIFRLPFVFVYFPIVFTCFLISVYPAIFFLLRLSGFRFRFSLSIFGSFGSVFNLSLSRTASRGALPASSFVSPSRAHVDGDLADGQGCDSRALGRPGPANIPGVPHSRRIRDPGLVLPLLRPAHWRRVAAGAGAVARRDSPSITGLTRRSTCGSKSTHGTSRPTPSTQPSDQQGQDSLHGCSVSLWCCNSDANGQYSCGCVELGRSS